MCMNITSLHSRSFVCQESFSIDYNIIIGSERPKRPKSVSAETEISAKLTEISAENFGRNSTLKLLKMGSYFQNFSHQFGLIWKLKLQINFLYNFIT